MAAIFYLQNKFPTKSTFLLTWTAWLRFGTSKSCFESLLKYSFILKMQLCLLCGRRCTSKWRFKKMSLFHFRTFSFHKFPSLWSHTAKWHFLPSTLLYGKNITHTTYKIRVNWLLMLSVRRPVNSRLLVPKFGGSRKLHSAFRLCGVLVLLVPMLF